MKKIYVLENISREGPGYLGQLMDQKQTLYEIIDLTQKQSFPALSQIKALIVMGGPDSANDQTLKITKEIAFIKEVLKAQIPYLGICLGLQIGVKAAGGTVRKNQVKEIGTRDQSGNLCQVSLSLEGLKDPLLLGLPHSIPVFSPIAKRALAAATKNQTGRCRFWVRSTGNSDPTAARGAETETTLPTPPASSIVYSTPCLENAQNMCRNCRENRNPP
jgi:anthranilate/para-aminobenzoate synthase component II